MIADPPSPTFLDTWLKESPQLPGLVVAGICLLILGSTQITVGHFGPASAV
jgi:hypothetical protein